MAQSPSITTAFFEEPAFPMYERVSRPSKLIKCATHTVALVFGLCLGLVASMLTFKEVLPFCGMENLHDTWCYQPCQIQEQCDSKKPSSTVRYNYY